MDQDIRFQMRMACTASAGGTAYLAVPYRCTLRDVRATAQAAVSSVASSASTLSIAVTETSSSGSLGTVATSLASSNLAAGALGEYTADASSGSNVLAADTVLKFDIGAAALSSACAFVLDIELDPYARSL